MKFIKKIYLAAIISLVFFLALFFTLKDYGMHEDNPFHFLRGQAYLQQILTGSPQFNRPNLNSPVLFAPLQRISTYKINASEEISASLRSTGIIGDNGSTIQEAFSAYIKSIGVRASFYKHNSWTVNYWDTIPNSHPAVSDTIMAFLNRIFYEALGFVGDIEGYYLWVIISVALAAFFVFYFTEKVFGRRTALFSVVSLALYPFFFAESHFNIKDPVQTSYFAIATISFYFWVKSSLKVKWFLVFVGSVFLALGTKWNIVFLPFIIIPWLFILRNNPVVKKNLTLFNIVFYGLLAIILPVIFLISAWPYLWSNTLPKLMGTLNFYSTLGIRDPRIEPPSFAPLPLGLDGQGAIFIFAMTPPLTLILSVIGMTGVFLRKIRDEFKAEWLVLFWFLVPLLRVSWQGASIYSSLRNFIEYLPALAILSGIGADYILAKVNIKFISFIIFIIYFSSLAYNIVKLHPNENLYFSSLIGGISGAKNLRVYDWESSYDNVYRQAVNWFNRNAPQKAKLAYLDGTMLAISPIWLREDIRFGSYFSGFDQQGEYIISLTYPTPPSVFAYNYLDRFLNPIYEIKIDGVIVAEIWRNSPTNLKDNFIEQKLITNKLTVKKSAVRNSKIWQIDLKKPINITKFILSVPKQKCIDNEVVWNISDGKKQQYFVPQKKDLNNGNTEFDFAGNPAVTVRFYDIQENTCLYQAQVEAIYGL